MRRYMYALLLMAIASSGCSLFRDGESPTSPSDTGTAPSPTPGGGTATTAKLVLHFLRPCRSGETPAVVSNSLPQCVRAGANEYGLVVMSDGPELRNAISLERALGTNESWSGGMLHLKEWTVPAKYKTAVPYVPGQTDRYSFPAIMSSGGKVDFSLVFQPGTSPGATINEIPVVLYTDMMQTNLEGCGVQPDAAVYHVRCTSVPK